MTTSEERGRQFDYDQSHWQMQILIDQLDELLRSLDQKQGDLEATEKMISLLRVKKTRDERKTKNFSNIFFM
jgi:hypothetical protein